MARRTTSRRRKPARSEPAALQDPRKGFDWRNSAHWNPAGPERCIYCRGWAHLLDDLARPAHKVCSEAAAIAAEEQQGAA